MRLLSLSLVILFAMLAPAKATDPPRVVVSIKPLHGLVAALLDGIAEPTLLVEGSASPHTFAMRPSDSRALQQADLVVWIGPQIEGFLVKPLSAMRDNVQSVALALDTRGLKMLNLEDHDHDSGHGHNEEHDRHRNKHHEDGHKDGHGERERHAEHAEDHSDEGEAKDPHIWTSPANARLIARRIAEALAPLTADPKLAENVAALDNRLVALDTEVREILEPVHEIGFVVFHPAYNYFVDAYHLNQVGVVSDAPELGTSAKHVSDLHHEIEESGAKCAFYEPQFPKRAVEAVAVAHNLRTAELDPLGADIPAGPASYEASIRDMATQIANCLSGNQ